MIPQSRLKISMSFHLFLIVDLSLKLISLSRVTVEAVPDDKPKAEHINLNKNLEAK